MMMEKKTTNFQIAEVFKVEFEGREEVRACVSLGLLMRSLKQKEKRILSSRVARSTD